MPSGASANLVAPPEITEKTGMVLAIKMQHCLFNNV